jgi:hypothetical protein
MFYVEPEINAPKQYACFFETLLLEAKKTGKLFLIRTADKLHSAIKLFCLSLGIKIIHPLKEVPVSSTSCKLMHVYTSCLG